MKKLHSISLFGLIMISLMIVTVLAAAAAQTPAGLLVMAGVVVFLLATRSGLRALNESGAVSVGGDDLHRLYTMKLTDAAAARACGEIAVIGGRVVESCDDYVINTEGVYIYRGKRIWPKEGSLAIAAWAEVYWDASANAVTTTAAGNTPLGYCVEAAAAADTAVTFYLLPVANGAITAPAMKTRTVVALSDAAATPTATQMIDSSIFTMTPGAGRNFTTPTAAQLTAACKGAQVGTWFDFTIISLAAFAVTVVAGSGVTLVGQMASANNASATFRVRFDNVTGGAEAVTVYKI